MHDHRLLYSWSKCDSLKEKLISKIGLKLSICCISPDFVYFLPGHFSGSENTGRDHTVRDCCLQNIFLAFERYSLNPLPNSTAF